MTDNLIGFAQESARNETITVGTSNTILSDVRNLQNLRKNILLRNTSTSATAVITLNLGYNQAVAGAGIVLKQNESFSDSSETGYEAYQGVITGICNEAGGKLAIYER